MKEKILEEYQKNIKVYDSFKDRIVHLITDLLSEQEIQIHQISSRNKTVESLSKKIYNKNDKYSSINDITDVIGVRIITYLGNDVDAISDLIKKEFIIDEKNSIDKRQLKSDQFGYRSLHIVASFNEDRYSLKEYRKYKEIKCEIQIRSILQHAWAEIEHDLGYKGEISIPEPYKRTFNRLSALLETADVEFDRLKTELTTYEKNIPQLIQTEPELVDINKASILSFLQTNAILVEAKEIIERTILGPLTGDSWNDITILRIKQSNFKTIASLENLLEKNKIPYLNFVKIVAKNRLEKNRNIVLAAPIAYFLHYLVVKEQDEEKLQKYFEESGYLVAENDVKDFIGYYLQSIQI